MADSLLNESNTQPTINPNSQTIDSPTPKVSVIMNCLNGAEYLREAIDSVYAQTYTDWEIVFWDNASTDNSAEIAKSYDGRLRYFKGNATVPLYMARNFALELTEGDYVAFLDCDDFWHPEKLQKQIEVFEGNPLVDFVYSNYYIVNHQENRRYPGMTKRPPEKNLFRSFLYSYPVNLQTVTIRKRLLDEFGGRFDERLNMCGDYDLFMRMLYKCATFYIHKPLAFYRVHPNMCSLKHIQEYPLEMEYVLGKFLSMDTSFENKHKKEIAYFRAKLGYWRARAEMARGSTAKARFEIKPYRFIDYKFFLLYLATSMPPFVWRLMHGIGRKTYY